MLLEKYNNWVAGDTNQIKLSALDGLKILSNKVLANYKAHSPWLCPYVNICLAHSTMLQSDMIGNTRWHDNPAFDSITNTCICNYEDGKLPPEPALLELFSHSWSLETHFCLFILLKAPNTSADPELARVAPLLTEQLVSHMEGVIGTTFHNLFRIQTIRELEAYLFLMETIHPQWETLSQDWKIAFAQQFLAEGIVTFLGEVPRLLETYFRRGMQYGVSASRTKQPPPQGSAGTPTTELITPVEKGSELQTDTPWDIIQGYHEKWITAAKAYLPFLANTMQGAPEYMTKDVVAQIKAQLPRLPD